MKILFVTPSFYPAKYYGGPTFINRSYCEVLASKDDVDLHVLTTDSDGPYRRIDRSLAHAGGRGPYSITYCRRVFPPDIAPSLLFRLFAMIRRADIVHLNGVYSFTTIPTLALCRLMRKPVVWSTFGGLQRWPGATHKRAKKIWDLICSWISARARVLLHVTSEEEKIETLERINTLEILVLRNGIEIPELQGPKNTDPPLRLLFMGRLHPIKGLENLLQALRLVKTDFTLSICGEGDAEYAAHLKSMTNDFQLADRVHFQGPVSGSAKEQQFSEACVCIVPSFKESFCTVVLEALARAVPVIASTGTPWQAIAEMGCGWWVNNDPDEFAKAIDRAASMPLVEMGLRGRNWMMRDYSWFEVVDEMQRVYASMIHTAASGERIRIPSTRRANGSA